MAIIISGEPKARKSTKTARPILPSRAVQKNYRQGLFQLNQILKAQTERISELQRLGAPASQIFAEIEAALAQSDGAYAAASTRLANQFVDSLDQDNRRKFQSMITDALGVDSATVIDGPATKELIELGVQENVNLIKSIPQEHFDKVSRAVLDNYRGTKFEEGSLTNRLKKIGSITDRRAKFIARDQTAKLIGSINEVRQADAGIKEYVWRNMRDQRVVGNPGGLYPKGNKGHMDHWTREGKTYKWGSPPADGHPGEAYNCIPGDSKIDFTNGCRKLYRRKFSGEVVSLECASGNLLEATGNHPVLTSRGWLPADDVQEGDYLVKARINRLSGIKANESEIAPSASDLFESMLRSNGFSSAESSAFNFHGEIPENEVDIVNVKRFLPNWVKPRIVKSLEQLNFACTNRDVSFPGLDLFRDFSFIVFSNFSTSDSGVSRLNKCLSFFRRKFALPNKHGGRPASPNSSFLIKNSCYDLSTYSVFFGKSFDALSRGVKLNNLFFRKGFDFISRLSGMRSFSRVKVWIPDADMLAEMVGAASKLDGNVLNGSAFVYEFDRVINKSGRVFESHVYNLETESNWYSVNGGFVVHNCRCRAEPKIDIEEMKRNAVSI